MQLCIDPRMSSWQAAQVNFFATMVLVLIIFRARDATPAMGRGPVVSQMPE